MSIAKMRERLSAVHEATAIDLELLREADMSELSARNRELLAETREIVERQMERVVAMEAHLNDLPEGLELDLTTAIANLEETERIRLAARPSWIAAITGMKPAGDA